MAVSEPNQPSGAILPQSERMNYEPPRPSLPVTVSPNAAASSSSASSSPVSQPRLASSPVGPSAFDKKPGAIKYWLYYFLYTTPIWNIPHIYLDNAEPPVVIDLDDIQELVATSMSTSDYTPVIRRVGSLFSKHENLAVSFVSVCVIF